MALFNDDVPVTGNEILHFFFPNKAVDHRYHPVGRFAWSCRRQSAPHLSRQCREHRELRNLLAKARLERAGVVRLESASRLELNGINSPLNLNSSGALFRRLSCRTNFTP